MQTKSLEDAVVVTSDSDSDEVLLDDTLDDDDTVVVGLSPGVVAAEEATEGWSSFEGAGFSGTFCSDFSYCCAIAIA